MKRITITLVAFISILLILSCKESEEKKAQKAKDLITIKTLGLAYLEEFELEKAEAEFEKFIDLAPKDKFGYANLGLTYLRMARYQDAEKNLNKALIIDPNDSDIRLILATVFKMQENHDKAINELKEALKSSPGHIKVLYELTEILAAQQDEASQSERKKYMLLLAGEAPGNLVPALNLTDIYIRTGELDSALARLEDIKKQFPDFPKEAVEYYNASIDNLKKADQDNAIIQFTIFHNYMKVTAPYQAGIMDLKGPGGSLIGFPLITFDQQSSLTSMDGVSVLESLKFTDVTGSSGLNVVPPAGDPSTRIASSDFDSDGDVDIYAGAWDSDASVYRHFLFSNELGRFTDITKQAGINHTGREFGASFVDYDNDGFLDLYILKEGGNILYRNAGKASFENVSSEAGINDIKGGNKAVFFDADHDGDLDLYQLMKEKNGMFRNNADGTFSRLEMGVEGNGNDSRDAVYGDFDEDGDIDLFVANLNGSNTFYLNQRQSTFRDATVNSGLESKGGSSAVDAGDYNNDGFLDLVVASENGDGHRLYRNLNDGNFEFDVKASGALSSVRSVKATEVRFMDFDNDGYLDILLAGQPAEKTGKGLFIFHNDGNGGFTDKTDVLPEGAPAASQISIFDYNDDGDQDMAVGGLIGGISLLRNDGGNNNHFIKMKLVGLKAGSAKNNHFGIGAKVEVRSGELYQTMVVTDPDVHFGLGNRKQADVVRITWTNGVPQNIFMPNSDQALIEAQTLKGSCPFLYTWNGKEFVFTRDILWRSALGMPLGIMGGTTAYGFAAASDDYIKLPPEILKPRNGRYSLQVTSELWETIYFDKLELLAVDHPATTEIFVPEQFSPPPFPGCKIYQTHKQWLPQSVSDAKGNDVLSFISRRDDVYLGGFNPEKYQGIVEMHELIIDPGKQINTDNIILFLHGWIFPTDASINASLSQSDQLKVMTPEVQVRNRSGKWTTIANPGFPMGKDKTVVVDLSGKFLSQEHQVRIVTNMEIYWDHVFFGSVMTDQQLQISKARQISADLHYRGFSRVFRKGGRYGPHWFDYAHVDTAPKWRDLTGKYTRFGNVLPLIDSSDNQYVISNAGDEMTVEFDAESLPPLQSGWKRDFLIRSVGWVKDGDLNTAYGQTVLPLPFHGMKQYTPSAVDRYPDGPEMQKYNSLYNTREVTGSRYLNALKN
ncbi:MAG TPA: FG-GAP-like repeat-containing protein [Bacteroidales bacterium]|jgi:tetratricopeptide (TPR) repeat protein|nr:FG-GAP-like repeat-containing protein [Bacteroidales bacterium]